MINSLNTGQSVGKIPAASRFSVTKTRSTALEHLQSSGRNALELEAISCHFGALVALADINMTVKAGERRAVLGSNGAGKTTLFNTVTGDIPPTTGRVRLFGEDVADMPSYERAAADSEGHTRFRCCSAVLPLSITFFLACSGVKRGRYSLIRPRREDHTMESAETLISAVHLDAERDTPVATLSHGQQRQLENRLGVGRCATANSVRRTSRWTFSDRTFRACRNSAVAAGSHQLHHHRT